MKGNTNMKTTIYNIVYGLMVMGALVVSVPMSADSLWTNMPITDFQSTSTMDGSGSAYSSNPTLDEDGTANSPSGAKSGVRKSSPALPPTPTIDPNDTGNAPIGDAVLPLLLMALGYAFVRYRRKQRFNAFAF